MVSREFRWTWLALLSAAAVTGCGGGGSSTNATPAPAPSPSATEAATVAANTSPTCTGLGDFYWEIGDKDGPLASGQVGSSYGATTEMEVASSSKWIYASYVAERRNGQLDPAHDVPFLNFTSGYHNMGNITLCVLQQTVNQCLNQGSATQQTPSDVGVFYYDSGHMENHASLYMGLGDDTLDQLGAEVSAKLGVSLSYAEPVMAGGVKITSTEYAKFLRRILSGPSAGGLQMHNLLGSNSVCTGNAGCTASGYSPTDSTGLNWRYSMGHWVESDGTFSSAGAFGYYPWIDKSVRYYGILARHVNVPVEQEGLNSAMCGAAIRQAWLAAQAQ
jgi:hypothetical protein